VRNAPALAALLLPRGGPRLDGHEPGTPLGPAGDRRQARLRFDLRNADMADDFSA
jgi:hypothetical protein